MSAKAHDRDASVIGLDPDGKGMMMAVLLFADMKATGEIPAGA